MISFYTIVHVNGVPFRKYQRNWHKTAVEDYSDQKPSDDRVKEKFLDARLRKWAKGVRDKLPGKLDLEGIDGYQNQLAYVSTLYKTEGERFRRRPEVEHIWECAVMKAFMMHLPDLTYGELDELCIIHNDPQTNLAMVGGEMNKAKCMINHAVWLCRDSSTAAEDVIRILQKGALAHTHSNGDAVSRWTNLDIFAPGGEYSSSCKEILGRYLHLTKVPQAIQESNRIQQATKDAFKDYIGALK